MSVLCPSNPVLILFMLAMCHSPLVDRLVKAVYRQRANPYSGVLSLNKWRGYEPDGALKETRLAGTYKAGLPEAEPHQDGGGDEYLGVLFSLRPYLETNLIYEILDDDHQIALLMTFDDLNALYYCLS